MDTFIQQNGSPFQPAKRRAIFVGVFALLSLVVAFIILAYRNIYDDELVTFALIHFPLRELWQRANELDVHPPGMYALARLCFLMFNSERWMCIVPLLVWTAGACVFAWSALPQVRSAWGGMIFMLLTFFHPQVLMWTNSNRWYPYWSGLALAILGIAYFPRVPESADAPPRWRTMVFIGCILGCMAYLNYLTGVFALALTLGFFVRFGVSRTAIARIAVAGIVAFLIFLPQLSAFMNVHLQNTELTQHSSMGIAIVRLAYALSVGEALMPWHPAALLVGALTLLPSFYFFCRSLWKERAREVVACAAFALFVLVMAIVSGLGGSARSFVFLAPLMALMLAIGAEQSSRKSWRSVASVLIALWLSVGTYHLIARTGTAKNSLNDHTDEWVDKIVELSEGRPALVVTHNPAIAYEINRRRRPDVDVPLTVLSAYPDWMHNLDRGIQGTTRAYAKVFVVETYIGALRKRKSFVRDYIESAKTTMESPRTLRMGDDPDAAMKSKMSSEDLPAARFILTYGATTKTDWSALISKAKKCLRPEDSDGDE